MMCSMSSFLLMWTFYEVRPSSTLLHVAPCCACFLEVPSFLRISAAAVIPNDWRRDIVPTFCLASLFVWREESRYLDSTVRNFKIGCLIYMINLLVWFFDGCAGR